MSFDFSLSTSYTYVMPSVTLPLKIKKELKDFSKQTGVAEGDLLTNALLYYFHNIKEKVEFRKELELWDRASKEDLKKFEEKL